MTTRGRYNPPYAPAIETDPIFSASYASGITGVDGTTIENTAGVLNVKPGVYQPAGSYLTAEADTLATVVARGANAGATINVGASNTLSLASGSITDSSGAIDFGNENLSTSGTGQFDKIGVGIAPNTNNGISVYLLKDAAQTRGISLSHYNTRNNFIAVTSITGVEFQAGYSPLSATSARTATTITGGLASAFVYKSSTSSNNATGTNVRGYYAQISASEEGGTGVANIGTATLFYAARAVKGGGAITTAYSFYDTGQDSATNNWGFYGRTANHYLKALQIGGTATVGMGDGTLSISGLTTANSGVECPKSKLTTIGGYAVKLTNKTGTNTVAGQLVKADTATDDAVILTAANDDECFGVFLDSGIADGSEAWVVVSGIADVAMADNTAATHGNWVATSSEAGYADATGASPAAAPVHFQEIGHCIETVSAGGAGTHILARCVLHFN